MTEDKISVILLTYNRSNLVCKSLDSVLKQNYHNLEIIIIDDGSSDDTLEVLKSFNDPRILIISLKHSGHISKLRNYGIKNATGKYIAFLDSDDIWDSNHLYNQISILKTNPNSGLIFSDIELIEDNVVIQKNIYKDKFISKTNFNVFNHIISGNITPIRPSTLLFLRSALNIGNVYNENLLAGEYNFLLRLTCKNKACFCTYPLVKILKHKNNISNYIQIEDFYEVIFTLKELYKFNYISKNLYKERLPIFHYKIFKKYIQRRDLIKIINQFLILLTIKPSFFLTKIFRMFKLK